MQVAITHTKTNQRSASAGTLSMIRTPSLAPNIDEIASTIAGVHDTSPAQVKIASATTPNANVTTSFNALARTKS